LSDNPQGLLQEMVGDRYRLERDIGAGHRCVAYEAADVLGLLNPVAVKVQRNKDTLVRDSLDREVLILAQLRSAFVPRAIGRGLTSDGRAYVAMSLNPGFTVKEALALRGGPFGVATALWILSDVCAAISGAHEFGVVHGAVSPASVILSRGVEQSRHERATLLNFGHSAIVDPARYRCGEEDLGRAIPPQLPPMWAPPHYPAAYADRAAVGYACDMAAAGFLLFEMLTGARAEFDVPVRQVGPVLAARGIPEDVRRLCERVVSPSVRDWFETADDLFEETMTCVTALLLTPNLPAFPGSATLKFVHSLERPVLLGWRGRQEAN
jgi:serine/threonine protein kinase